MSALLNWVSRSLGNKALVVLVLLGIVPLVLAGIIIYVMTTRLLTAKMNYMAQQTIDKLSLSVSKDLQGFSDVAFYSAQNGDLRRLVSVNTYKGKEQTVFYDICGELQNNQVTSRLDYPYQYVLVTKGGIFTNFTYVDSKTRNTIMSQLSGSTWYTSLSQSHFQRIIITQGSNLLSKAGEKQLYISANLIVNMEPIAVLSIGVDSYYISKLLQNVRITNRSSVYVLNGTDCVVEGDNNYMSFSDIPKNIVASIAQSKVPSLNYNINGKKYFITTSAMYIGNVEGNWKTIMVTPAEDITKDVSYIKYVVIGTVLLSVIAILFLILMIDRQVIKPVIRLNKIAKEAEKGNLDVRANDTRTDELGQLAVVFNGMLGNIKENIRNIKKEDEIKRKLELDVLQSQINPHFIHNTLNIIRWMAEMMGVPSISKALMSFSRMIDFNCGEAETTVTVREEVEYLEEYIYLQKLRCQNKFVSKIEIEDDLLDLSILKLILQPVVENSIIHGLEKKTDIGTLSINGYREDQKMIFVIHDDGVGMSEETLKHIFEPKNPPARRRGVNGIGLANVMMRIRLNYGDEYGISLSSKEGAGTDAVITLPCFKYHLQAGERNETADR